MLEKCSVLQVMVNPPANFTCRVCQIMGKRSWYNCAAKGMCDDAQNETSHLPITIEHAPYAYLWILIWHADKKVCRETHVHMYGHVLVSCIKWLSMHAGKILYKY